nr:hypothetical protein [uncultured Carboxylicivirga sp.]
MAFSSDDPEVQKSLDKLQAIHNLREKTEMMTLRAEDNTIRNPLFLLESIIEFGWSSKKNMVFKNRTYETIVSLSELKIISLLEEVYESNLIERVAKDIRLTKIFHSKLLGAHAKLHLFGTDYTENMKGVLLFLESELLTIAKEYNPQKTLKEYLPKNEIVILHKTLPLRSGKKRKVKRVKSLLSWMCSLSIAKIIGLSILVSVVFGYIVDPEVNDYFNGDKISYSTFRKIKEEGNYRYLNSKTDINYNTALLSGLICFGVLLIVSKSNNKY